MTTETFNTAVSLQETINSIQSQIDAFDAATNFASATVILVDANRTQYPIGVDADLYDDFKEVALTRLNAALLTAQNTFGEL